MRGVPLSDQKEGGRQVGYAALGRRQTSVHIPATAEAWSAKTPAVYAGSCASLNTACACVCVQIYLRTTRYTEVPSSGELNGGYRQRTTVSIRLPGRRVGVLASTQDVGPLLHAYNFGELEIRRIIRTAVHIHQTFVRYTHSLCAFRAESKCGGIAFMPLLFGDDEYS